MSNKNTPVKEAHAPPQSSPVSGEERIKTLIEKLQREVRRMQYFLNEIEKEIGGKKSKTIVIRDKDGSELARMHIYEKTISVVPSIQFNENVPQFRNFLVKKIFRGLRSDDIASGKKSSEALYYKVVKGNDGNVTKFIIGNVDTSNEKTMKTLRSSIAWTLRRIKERTMSNSKNTKVMTYGEKRFSNTQRS
jgi:hypothetical protein